ncbi:MAG TPA: 2OG-Fe(II) oxygenase [Pirellulales bacterium]|nr:2OG-Fe(II) oxygenase [Pirellulales bacterium]
MSDSSTIEWLTNAIGRAIRSAKFCVAGCLPVVDPGLEVEELGPVDFPLKRGVAKQLIASCRVAPYGKGTRTLVDTKVRNTFELDPKQFRLGDQWNSAVSDATRTVAQQLGLPADRLEARLYKLLVYEKGGFFLPHRDSEKQNRMVASLIVVLPNQFEGGRLIIRHGAEKQALNFEEAAAGKSPCFAAFYADCEHEVERVTRGVRMALAYNLVLKPTRGKSSPTASPAAPIDALAESIESWIAWQPGEPLVFALEHHYTQRGLSLDLLKGGDRKLAELIVSAAERADCFVHLAQVQRHLQQWADDGSFGRGYRYGYDRTPRGKIEIGETYEDGLSGTQWTDIRGKKQPWEEISLELSAIVSSTPLEDWQPTSEQFEGYTGNAGNTLDRWYHRSAIVVWHRDHHFDVVLRSGAFKSVPLFCLMAAKLAKTSKKRLEDARRDCLRFARAIISHWPRRSVRYGSFAAQENSPPDDFAKHLLMLHDRDTIAMFLFKLAEQDQSLSLTSFVVAACREFGWNAFAHELKHLLSPRSDIHGRQEVPFRDIEWLSAFCCGNGVGPDQASLAEELCALAVERFCAPYPPQSTYYSPHDRREPSVSEKSLPLLLKALLSGGRDADVSQVIRFVQQAPDEFRLGQCQIPALKELIPWSEKQFGRVHPQLASWLAFVRKYLESATAIPPKPPTDWARPANADCQCQFCTRLNAFLADPANEVGRIAAREDARWHVIGTINRHQCDVKHALERKGSPYSLVLTKTTGSFDRAVKQFKADCRLLSELPPES